MKNGIKKVVFSSTGSVYGEPLHVPMDEDHPYNSETIYGTTKIAGEHLLRDFYRAHGLEFVALRYFNVYGPRQHYKGAYAQIVPRWVDRLVAGESLVIHGDGSQTMDMTYVTDIARANVLALESDVTHDFVNVGTGDQHLCAGGGDDSARGHGHSCAAHLRQPGCQSCQTASVCHGESQETLEVRGSSERERGPSRLLQVETGDGAGVRGMSACLQPL